MYKYLVLAAAFISVSFFKAEPAFKQHVTISISRYLYNGDSMTSVLPEIKADSELKKFERRFSYLLMNVPELHTREKLEARNSINALYPDTTLIKQRYIDEYLKDEKLINYFNQTIEPINNSNYISSQIYTVNELMEVASKFFYCDMVMPDTSIQAHVCIGLNGIKEAQWDKDYTLLEAFCYEGIFYAIMDDETSNLWDEFSREKKTSVTHFRPNITSLNKYLEDVKLDVFEKMKNSETLKKELLHYYFITASNLAFKLITE